MASSIVDFALPERTKKPRAHGLTSMVDFGPDTFGWSGGERGIQDLLDVAGEYIDYVKIYALNALLIPPGVVKRTTALYRDAGVQPFAGGILFEYAYLRNEVDHLIAFVKKLGIPGLEISENYLTLAPAERDRMIERLQKAGLRVVYEFGRKNPEEPASIECLEDVVSKMAAHGINHITVEQCEIDLLANDALRVLSDQPWFNHVVIEVDPYRFPEQHATMIRDFGSDVNLANVTAGQVLRLEGFRRGVGRAVNYSVISGDNTHAAGVRV